MQRLRTFSSLTFSALALAYVFAGCATESTSADDFKCSPSTELCNTLDDDCDGLVDEGDDGLPLVRDCSNGCGTGTEVCSDGKDGQDPGYWVNCSAPEPATETCNGIDDDCDGFPDNGFECTEGEEQVCGTDVGTCEKGMRTCGTSCSWNACKGDIEPEEEACEGVEDEDCDGTVDNGCSCNDGEVKDCCGGVQIECENGVWPSCPTPPTEVCNGLDDDCSGVVDDNLNSSPYLDDESSSGVDSCAEAFTEPFIAPFNEGAAAKTFMYFLVKEDGSEDRDFFSFTTFDTTDVTCAGNTDYYECFELEVKLTQEPAGSDLELCVYDIGSPGPSSACDSYEKKACSNEDGNPPNVVKIGYEGGCGFFGDDARQYVLEVFYAQGSPLSCESYKLSIAWDADDPQPDACSF